MADSVSTSSSEGIANRIHCCEVLCGLPETVIQDGTSIATGLTWPKLEQLRCEGYTCMFCRLLRLHGLREKAYKARRRNHHSAAMESESQRQLVLHFGPGIREGPNGNDCLKLTTEMVSFEPPGRYDHSGWRESVRSESVRLRLSKGSRYADMFSRNSLEVVGDFGRTNSRTGPGLGARRLVTEQFDASILRNWIVECDGRHGHQRFHQSTAESPLTALLEQHRLRLINVWTHTLITATAISQRYLALSYVWGSAQISHQSRHLPSLFGKHGVGNREHLISDWETLPRTIRDAAELVKDIGEKYLWVDAICINQSDPDDLRCLVPEMGTIYGCSLVTIVSTGEHADTGLPGISASSRKPECCTQISFGQQILQLVRDQTSMYASLEKSKWSTRGWTFQEFLLSDRAVIFAEEQVYFICAKGEQAEAYAISGQFGSRYYRKHFHRRRVAGDDGFMSRLIFSLIEDYTGRELTHMADRFNAFMGAARVLQPGDISSETCVALRGLPLQWFWESLSWASETFPTYEPPVRIAMNHDQSLALPSWSWVGWTGKTKLYWSDWGLPANQSRFEVILLDHANIVLKPTNEPDQYPYWRPWPVEPERHLSNTPNAVTLHMWAPCVECHFIPAESVGVCSQSRNNGRFRCAIILRHKELGIETPDSLFELHLTELDTHPDNLGTIWRSMEEEDTKPHRQVQAMAVFPKSDGTSVLILLGKYSKDPDITIREDRISTTTRNILRYAKDRYVRMQ